MLDGVDDRLADGDADPVDRVLVEPAELRHVVADHLDEIEHLEVAVDLSLTVPPRVSMQATATPAPTGPDAAVDDGIGGLGSARE